MKYYKGKDVLIETKQRRLTRLFIWQDCGTTKPNTWLEQGTCGWTLKTFKVHGTMPVEITKDEFEQEIFLDKI